MATRQPGREQVPPAHAAIAGLERLSEAFAERRRQLAAEAGLTETQWRALEEVGGGGFLPSMFARQRSVSAAAVSRTLRQLGDRGLVASGIGAEDARQRVYRLTRKGREALDRLEAAREEAVQAVWATFPSRDLEAFGRLADEIAQRMEEYAAGR